MYRFTTRVSVVLVALATLCCLGLGAASTASAAPKAAAPTPAVTTAPVTGTLADGTGAVDGTFTLKKLQHTNGTVTAVGTYTGTITDAAGKTLASGTQRVALPISGPTDSATPSAAAAPAAAGSCQILDLVLGPLDLDLLGLQVHLDVVHLNLTAQQGAGNLLGNLLCALTGLLDGPTGLNAILNQVVNLINQLLGGL